MIPDTVLLATSSGFDSPSLQLMLDTADDGIALLVAYLGAGRFARRHHWQDRFLAPGLVLLAGAGAAPAPAV